MYKEMYFRNVTKRLLKIIRRARPALNRSGERVLLRDTCSARSPLTVSAVMGRKRLKSSAIACTRQVLVNCFFFFGFRNENWLRQRVRFQDVEAIKKTV